MASPRATVTRRLAAAILMLLLHGAVAPATADIIVFVRPADPIVSASIAVDFAAFTAHRMIAGFEVNSLQLIDLTAGLGVLDLSATLFGTTDALFDAPLIDQGSIGTGLVSASIDASFFPALAGGRVGLHATFTDTFDALFAMDYIALTVNSAVGATAGTIDSNNGFGIGLADGGMLPLPLPLSVAIGATGTGFDESISSKSLDAVPEPAAVVLWGMGLGLIAWRRRGSR